jgi:hypothetical protein
MAAPKGTRPPAAGKGRKPGSRNKLTADVKALILGALDAVGGQAYLEQQAQKNPVAFMALIGKVLPMQVGGVADEPIKIQWINYADAGDQA